MTNTTYEQPDYYDIEALKSDIAKAKLNVSYYIIADGLKRLCFYDLSGNLLMSYLSPLVSEN